MRFLYTFAALSLSSLSLASGQTLFPSQNQNCVVKTTSSSLGSTACQIQQSAWVNILDTTPISVPIPTFDENAVPAGAILDAVHINWIDLGYQASGTYNVTSTGGSASSFSVITSVANNNVWLLYSDVDGSTIDALSGGFSVNPGTGGATGNPCRTETDTQTTPHTTICRNGDIYSKPFQLTDDRYASSTLNSGTVATFSADFGVTGTVTSFEGLPVNSATSGYALVGNSVSFNLNAVPSNSYKSSTSPTWNLITGTASNTPAHISGTLSVTTGATGVGLYLSHTLTALVQVQYDYHLPAVGGDPQFSGFQGQNFQVHGAPESYFALISAPNYYVNARFDYLSTGRCDYNETQCFTHPGTYMGLIYVGMKDANILIQAGPHTTGFAGILVNDKPITVGDRFTLSSISSNSYIQVLSKSKLVLSLDNIIINVINSDLFVNFDLALTDKQLLTSGSAYHVMPNGATSSQIAHKLSKWYGAYNPLHGLIGQTWRNVKYADNKLYQGDITEYQLDKIIDHTFLYCVYEP